MSTAPSYGVVGTSTPPRALLIGAYEQVIRKVGTVANDGGTPATHPKGEVLYQGEDGRFRALTEAMLTPAVAVTAVTGEAVGSGTGSQTVFTLKHTPVVASTLAVTVAGTESTDWTLDANTGRITFGTAPASDAAIVAGYSYFDAYAEAAVDKALVVDRVLAVLEEETVVAARVGDAVGTAQARIILKGEVAQDLLYLGGTVYGSLGAATGIKLTAALTASGIVPGAVVR